VAEAKAALKERLDELKKNASMAQQQFVEVARE
jgi:hypothetical protein